MTDRPVYKTKKNRVRRALAMYYGMGADEPATIPEIAAELDVTEQTVEHYVNDNPIAEEVQRALDELAAKTRKEIAYDLLERLASLRAIEEQLMAATTTQVTGYDFEEVRATVKDVKEHGLTVEEPDEITVETVVPIPREIAEVPQLGQLKEVWEEQRQTQQQLASLLGLNAPEELDLTTETTERKIWAGVEDDPDNDYPDQEVVDLEDEDSV
jgi:predicted transcriptional regulator